jgi:hypothetical protein
MLSSWQCSDITVPPLSRAMESEPGIRQAFGDFVGFEVGWTQWFTRAAGALY